MLPVITLKYELVPVSEVKYPAFPVNPPANHPVPLLYDVVPLIPPADVSRLPKYPVVPEKVLSQNVGRYK